MPGIVDAKPEDIQRARELVVNALATGDLNSIASTDLPECTIINALRELGHDPQRKVIVQTVTYLSFTTQPFRQGEPINIYLTEEISESSRHWSAF